MRIGITAKLMLIPAALVSLALLAVGLVLERRERGLYIDGVADRLRAQAALLAPELRDLSPPAVAAWARAAGQRAGARVTVVATDGRVLGDSHHDPAIMENRAGRPEIREALAGRLGRSLQERPTLRREELRLAVPAPGGLALRLSLPLEALAEALWAIRSRVLAVSALALAGTLGLGYLLARHLTRPVQQMVRQSQAIADGDLSRRTAITSNDEIADLARSLNRMAEALQESLRRLEAERDRVRTILERMAEGVILIDPDGRIGLINAGGARILGVPVDRAAGQRMIEACRSFDLHELLARARTEGQAAGEFTLPFPAARLVEATAVALRDGGAGPTGIVLVLRDVTQLRRLEAIRMEFVANVSHELRTPLTAIRGFVETLLDGALESPGEARRFLETVARHAERLARLLDDLLDLSNIELGKVSLRFEPLGLAEVIEHAVGGLTPLAAKKAIALAVEVGPALPSVRADRDRLVQILVNLVDNAIKFTLDGGHITIGARRATGGAGEQGEGGGALVEVTVTDNGIGIAPKDLPRITERFYRVDKTRSRELGGTGLGLAIVKHLVQAHGGELRIDSEPGRGTRVSFTLPVASIG
jgi:two-component system phosphate regulon sensor histidine kinase PhoR